MSDPLRRSPILEPDAASQQDLGAEAKALLELVGERTLALRDRGRCPGELQLELAAQLIAEQAREAGHDLDDVRAAIEQVTGRAIAVDAEMLAESRATLAERALAELPSRP